MKPRIVAIGFDSDGPVAKVLQALGGTVRFGDDLSVVRLRDYDFVVTTHLLTKNLPSHINGIQFLEQMGVPYDTFEYQEMPGRIGVEPGSRAADFVVDAAADSRGATSVLRETVMAAIPVESDYDVLTYSATNWTGRFEPLVSEKGGKPVAALALSPKGREWWYLPEFTISKERVIQALFSRWRKEQPGYFEPSSEENGDWKTNAELDALDAIAEYELQTAKLLQERQAREAELQAVADAVSREADQREKRHLTSKGQDLESAVEAALTTLGFDVVNSDERQEARGAAKREDLEVKIHGKADWVALVEVKGYETRSARTSDIGQLQKAAGFYARDNGQEPTALWYVVNANHSKTPDARPIPLESSPDDVEVFAEDGGAVIDTRELFRMVRAVQAGTMTTTEAVAALASARGIFSAQLPQPTSGATKQG